MKEESSIFQTDSDLEKTIKAISNVSALKMMKRLKMPETMTEAYIKNGGKIVPVFDAYTGKSLPFTKDDMNRINVVRDWFNTETCMIIKLSWKQTGYEEIELFPGIGRPETKCFTKLECADDDTFTLIAPGFLVSESSFGYKNAWRWVQVTVKGKREKSGAWELQFIGREVRPGKPFFRKSESIEEKYDFWDDADIENDEDIDFHRFFYEDDDFFGDSEFPDELPF
ncbi:MAG: hypothetical protein IJM02_00300 [Clostridia bacterium]|nr:hypothetical protein [Clostridia bacterium]